MNAKFSKTMAAMILLAMLIGNIPLVMATPSDAVNGIQYHDGDWTVVGSEAYTNEVIYLTGNLTVPVGAILTLTNTSVLMNCSFPGEYYIDVRGTLIMQDGGDGISPNFPGDSDPSIITANNTADRPYFWVQPGATFTATNSIVEYMGVDPFTGTLTGGLNPESDWNEWVLVTNGSFRIAIDGDVRNVENMNFSAVTSMTDVATVITNALQDFDFGGFASATCTWVGPEFTIESGTTDIDGLNVMESSVALLGTHSTGAGVDISGMANRSGVNTWWMDCALNATADNMYSSYLGPYMHSPSVSISNCLFQNNQNGLIFDSVYPAVLQNNNISWNTDMGLLISNITDPNFALPSVTLSNNNVIGNGEHGVAIQASTIGIEAFNMNVSENSYGMNFYSKGNMNANVHDCILWYNTGSTHMHATGLLMWTGPAGILTGTVERNNITWNDCGGLWAGYQFGGTASYDTTLLIRNNTFVGNDGKETFQAINNLNVKVFDNYFGGSDYNDEADGMRIGCRHGDNYDFAPADTFVKNLVLVVANNIFDYGNYSDNWDVGGAVLTAARSTMDATITGNTVWGGYQIGGLFRIGWPHPWEVCEGDPRFKRVDNLKAVVTNNDISIWKLTGNDPTVGGTINFFAEDFADIVCSDNNIYTEGGQMGGIIGVNHGAGWAGEYTVPCREVKVLIERNHITENISTDGNNFGGMMWVIASYRVTSTVRDNVLHRIMNGTDIPTQGGGSGSHGSPWIVMGHPDDDAEESNSKPVYIDTTIVGNKLWLDLNVTPTNDYWWRTGQLIRAYAIMEVKANIADNDFQIRCRFNGTHNEYMRMGSAIRLHAYGTVDAQIMNNDILIANNYTNGATGYSDLGGIIKVGSMDPTPQFVYGKIVGNHISFFDNSTSDTSVGSVIRINAQSMADMEITDNDIYIKAYNSSNDINIGEVFRIWKCVDVDSDFNVPQQVEMDLHRNIVKINNNATSSSNSGGGGIMRLHGLLSTVLRMTDNVFQYTTTNPLFNNDSAYDMGVRVGYHCYDDGILSSNVDVTTKNNIIGPGGVGNGFVVAGTNVKLDMNGDTIQNARYSDCGDMDYFTTEFTYGNGLVLLGEQIDANIRNVKLINNEGAGLYVDTTGGANLFLDNCYIYNNSWHGVFTKGQSGMTNMGRINNADIMWNGNDTNGDFGELGSGVYAINSKIIYSNCTLYNPNGSIEFNVTDTSFVTALNTQFNESRVFVGVNSHFLRQWFMNLKVQQLSSGNGIPFAYVDATELLGTMVYDSQVGADGWWRWIPMSHYIQDATTTTMLTAHTVNAAKGLVTGTATPLMTTNRDVIIILNYINLPPVANAGPDQTVSEDTIVTFDGSASNDDYFIVNWAWTCATLNLTLSGEVVTFNVTDQAGLHNVTLTVTDVEGFSTTDSILITVIDSTAPMANAGPDQTVNEDVKVTFDGTASTDNQAVANYTWTFGTVTLYGATPNYTFAQPGIYNVTLKVRDPADLTSTDNVIITVLDITAPIVIASAPQVVAEGTLVTLTSAGSTDNVGIVSYTWTFNDGSNSVTRVGQIINYTFRNRGNFTVTLTCKDSVNLVGKNTTWVRVEDQIAPTVLVVAPGQSLTGVPIDWELVVVFDEPMNTHSAETAFNISGGINITGFTWNANNRYVTIAFSDFEYNTTYTISITTAATDASGNPMAAAYSASFKTLAEPPAATVTDSDGDGVEDIEDAFPTDPAASVDADDDGLPDAWNPGYTEDDSTSGLVIDDEVTDDEETEDVETNFFTNNWWMLVVIIVVLAVLLLVQMLRGGSKEPAPPAPEPKAAPEAAPEPEATPAEEEIQ